MVSRDEGKWQCGDVWRGERREGWTQFTWYFLSVMIHTFCCRWICNWFSGLDSSAWFVPYLAKQVKKKNVFLVIFLFQCLGSIIFGQLSSWGSGVGRQPSTRSHYSWSSVVRCLTVSEGQRFLRGLQGLLAPVNHPSFPWEDHMAPGECECAEGREWGLRRVVYSYDVSVGI